MGGFFSGIGDALSSAWDAGSGVVSSVFGGQKGDGIWDSDLVNSLITVGGGLYSSNKQIEAADDARKDQLMYELELEKAKVAHGLTGGGGGGGPDPRTLELQRRQLMLQAYKNYMDQVQRGGEAVAASYGRVANAGQRALLRG